MQRDQGMEEGAPVWSGTSLAPVPMTSVGRHRIEGLLGRGGVGSVYRAYDSARDRYVAFKRLELGDKLNTGVTASGSASINHDSSLTAEDARKAARRRAQVTTLFQREFHTLAQLAHPRIIEVYDYGVDEQGPYYTMELLEGKDLSNAGPMPWRRACEVLRDVASALTLLHSRRLLHRDISPRNLHCAASGAAKLNDFGAMTPMGPCDVVVGTPAFVAPEAVAECEKHGMGVLGHNVRGALAWAEAKLGELESATARLDDALAASEASGISGLYVALRYEQRAMLAIQARDAEAFARAVARGREHYGVSTDSPFTARVARLYEHARAAGLISDVSAAQAEHNVVTSAIARLRRELSQCSQVEERAERALVLLVEVTGARHGHLYGMQNGELSHLASSHEPPPPALQDAMAKFIVEANEAESDVTEIVDSEIDDSSMHTTITGAGDSPYSPFSILADDDSTQVVAAVALSFASGTRRAPAHRLLIAIGEELTARGDLTRLTLVR